MIAQLFNGSSRLQTLAASTLIALSATLAVAQTTAPATQPTTRPENVLFTVNGEPVGKDIFFSSLYEIAGTRVFFEITELVIAKQACTQNGIIIGQEQVQAEKKRILDRVMAQTAAAGTVVTPEQAEAIFNETNARQGLSPIEVNWMMAKSACLRALAKGNVVINDDNVKEFYETRHGERADVRVFVFKTMEDAATVRKAAEAAKKPFAEVADERRIPSQQAVIPKNVNFNPSSFKDTAFQLKEGEASAVIPQPNGYFILVLNKKIPATGTKFEDVKDTLKKELQDTQEARYGEQILQRLMLNANLEAKDPLINNQLKLVDQMRTNYRNAATQAAAASQPAATTAPANKK